MNTSEKKNYNKFLKIVLKKYKHFKNKDDINILDWGCGSGGLIKYLKKNKFNCYGVEIDELKLQKNFFKKKKKTREKIVLINNDNKTKFEANYFDIVFTNQVIEHISDKDSFLNEINRILKTGGYFYNILPAKYRINEVHLKMPFIHWLPKNYLRKYLIFFFSLFKLKHWPECLNLSYKDKVNYYYNYSINKTFYISANQLFNKFQKFDFYVIDQPVKIRLFDNSLFKYLRNQFISIEFLAKKK
jgi:ubiquinone/menaquinone biosynthesis C-methylase UbiE